MKAQQNFTRMLEYCAGLEAHNERPWFHENHKWYEGAKADYLSLLERLQPVIANAAPDLAKDILYMQPKDWMYRIARDMRYYKNRPPYEASFRAYISRDRKSWQPIGYFLRIAPGASCYGTGIWTWNNAQANPVRDCIQEHWQEFEEIVELNDLVITGDQVKTMPHGYSEHHPAAEWVKFKTWSVIEAIPDEALTDFESFAALIEEKTLRMEPLRQFLLRASEYV